MAFNECTELEEIILPNNNLYIDSFVFNGCTSLKSITLPASVTEIPFACFQNCTSLQSVTAQGKITVIHGAAFSGCTALNSFRFTNAITEIGSEAFEDTQLTKEENGVLYFENWAIDLAQQTSHITLRDDTYGIANEAFSRAYMLKTITIPDRVKYVGGYVFSQCTMLRQVTLGTGVSIIPGYLFPDCPSLTSLVFPGTKSAWEALSKGDDWFNGALTVTCTDGEVDFSNIHAISSHIWWTNVSANSDKWNFNNPYIVGDKLYIDCYAVTFGSKLQWNDNGAGKLSGVASRSESFTLTAPVTGTYEKQTQAAGEAGRILLEVSLEDLYTDRPDELYFRLSATVNGMPTTVSIRFEITW